MLKRTIGRFFMWGYLRIADLAILAVRFPWWPSVPVLRVQQRLSDGLMLAGNDWLRLGIVVMDALPKENES